ncbi:hypothetical protein YTPLAS21_14130 [Candidatus Nitrosocosmicus sp.]|nr:hypothetical protein YTPLAS21_14130 [Candidatus Nitrosocosmicus sp.]
MNSKNLILILTVIFIGGFSLSIVYFQEQNFGLPAGFASSSSLDNPTDIVAEGNSTFSNSTQGENQVVSKVIVVPNPNSISDSNLDESALSNANNNNESDLSTTFNQTKNPSLQNNNDSGLESQESTNPQQNNNNNNTNTSSSQNPMQRGEYKVDDNGVHYYNINNCSLVKGSSGIGDLSECEDAEREIQQELNG